MRMTHIHDRWKDCRVDEEIGGGAGEREPDLLQCDPVI